MEFEKEGTCSLCGGQYIRWGNNPDPLLPFEKRCCDECNNNKVIPARLARVRGDDRETITGKVVRFGEPQQRSHLLVDIGDGKTMPMNLDYSMESRQQMIKYLDHMVRSTTNLSERAEWAKMRDMCKTNERYFRHQVDNFKAKIARGEYDQYKIPERKH